MDRINDTLSAMERNAESIKGTLEKMQVDRSAQSVSSINVNAGGIGVWIATTACCVMLAVAAIAIPVGVGAYLSLQARMDKLAEKDEIHDAWIQTINNNKQDKAK